MRRREGGEGGEGRGGEGERGSREGKGSGMEKGGGEEMITCQNRNAKLDVHTLRGSSGLLPSSNSAVISRGSFSNGFRKEKR